MRERAPGSVVAGLADAYVVVRKHGEGGFGVTYEATAQRTGERVVLKELKFERLSEWKSLELFEREGRVLAALSHRGIPAYRDFFALAGERAFATSQIAAYDGDDALSVWLVQVFVDGENLERRVRDHGPIDAEPIASRRAPTAKAVLALLDERPRSRATAPAPPIVVMLLVVGAILATFVAPIVVFTRRRPTSPRPPSAPVVQPALSALPAPPIAPTPPVIAPPSAPAAEPIPLAWRGSVTSASGIALAVASSCAVKIVVQPRVTAAEVEHTVVTCGSRILYDEDARLEGISNRVATLDEVPIVAETPSFRDSLVFTDRGERIGKSQATIATTTGQAVIKSDDLPPYRVVISVEPWVKRIGAPAVLPGAGALAAFTQRTGKVKSVRGHTTVAVGASCTVGVVAANGLATSCRALVKCGAVTLYGKGDTDGNVSCEVEGGALTTFTDDQSTMMDGDPFVKGSWVTGVVGVYDVTPVPFTVEITLD